MSIIAICTSKGGAGKTTLAEIILGCVVEAGFKAAAIDADFNHTLHDWITQFSTYEIDVRHELDETKLVDLAGELEAKHDLVVIDTAGASSQASLFAIGCADLVLVPVQLSSADVVEAIKTVRLASSASKMIGRDIPVRVVLMNYKAETNIADRIKHELAQYGLTFLDTKIRNLVAFQEMSFTGKVPDVDPAQTICALFIDELAREGGLPFFNRRSAA